MASNSTVNIAVAATRGTNLFTEWFVALSMSSFAYAFALTGGSMYALTIALLVGLSLPVWVVLLKQQYTVYRNSYNTFTSVLLAVYLVLNISFHLGNYSDTDLALVVARTGGFIAFLFWLNWVAANLEVRQVLSKLAFALIPLAFIMLVNIAFVGNRASAFGMQPNWWGELMVAFSICGLALRAPILRVGIYALAALVLFLVQSRSSMVGWVIVIAIDMLRIWNRSVASRRLTLVLVAAVLVIIVLEFTPLGLFVADKVLLFNNSYRGLGTGFTGRLGGWETALGAWADNPIFGRGMGLYTQVHNGFLQVVAEGGTVLGLMVLVFCIKGVRSALSRLDYLKLAGILAVSGYMAFQPRMFNLNLTSLIFWLALREWNAHHLYKDEDKAQMHSFSPTSLRGGASILMRFCTGQRDL